MKENGWKKWKSLTQENISETTQHITMKPDEYLSVSTSLGLQTQPDKRKEQSTLYTNMIWSFWAPKGQQRNPRVKALKSLQGIVFLSPSLTSQSHADRPERKHPDPICLKCDLAYEICSLRQLCNHITSARLKIYWIFFFTPSSRSCPDFVQPDVPPGFR